MLLEREWAMPNRATFSIKPIGRLLADVMPANGAGWIDPFAGWGSPAAVTNDLNPAAPTHFHLDALKFLMDFEPESVDGVLFDPPYSPRQVAECYAGIGRATTAEDTRTSFWSRCKGEIARIAKPGAVVVSCGWNSQGMGRSRGFRLDRVLLVAHGGMHNDTITTVETKGNLT